MQTYNHHSDYLLSDDAPIAVLEQHVLSPSIHLTRVIGKEFFADPSTPDLTIQWARSGYCRFSGLNQGFDQFKGTCYAGDFVTTAPNAPSSGSGSGDFECLVLGIRWAKFRPHLEETLRRDVPHLGGLLHSGIYRDDTVSRLIQLLNPPGMTNTLGTLYADSVTTALLSRLLDLSGVLVPVGAKGGLSNTNLKRVTDYISDNLAGNIALETLANLVAVSPFHFCRLFKQSTGLSPHQYVIQERVERAKHLLLRGNTVTQTAYTVGFVDAAHLHRHMKRLLGVTPGTIGASAYRRGGATGVCLPEFAGKTKG